MPDPLVPIDHAPRHALPLLYPGQAQKEAFLNEALARIDALLFPVVEDRRAAPPPDPAEGQGWLVATNAEGAWAGQAEAIAIHTMGDWLFLQPCDGMRVWDRAAAGLRFYDVQWSSPAVAPAPAGGDTVDIEARAAIAAITGQLRNAGIFSR